MSSRYVWLDRVDGTPFELSAGDYRSSKDLDEILFLERGLTVVRALDEGERDAFAQVRAAPGTIGLERLAGIRRTYEIHAVTDVHFVAISTKQVHEMMKEADDAHRSLVEAMAHVLGSCIEDRVAMSGSAKRRVARLLLSGEDGGIRFSRLPRRIWAEVLGMRAETMSRTIRQLDEEGLVEASPSRVVIRNSKALQQIIDEDDA